MSVSPVVSNASPIIALEQIGHLGLLHRLFSDLLIPSAVRREISPAIVVPSWIVERRLSQPIGARILQASLGAGESEAITLALELNARRVILDDRAARRLATALGLPVIGTLGVLLASKRKGFISSLRPSLDALVTSGFRIAPSLYELVLTDAGEAST